MVSRRHRFHGYTSLSFVYRRGTVTRDHHVSVRVVHNQRRSVYRVAVIVSRKVNKSAVRRNRIRRRVYEIVRSLESRIESPQDIVITVFSDQLADLPSSKLHELIAGLLEKSGVLKTAPTSPTGHAIVTVKEDIK